MVSYSNALPLWYGLAQDPELSLHYDTPNHLYNALIDATLDYSLTSSLHLQDERLLPFSTYCISANKEVLSVNLYHKGAIHELDGKEVAISSETTTSFALLKILCKKLWDINPIFKILAPKESIIDFDGALLIGDIALKNYIGFKKCDLATAWYQLTALPFVFALFFLRKNREPCSKFEKKIGESLILGLKQVPTFTEKVALEKKLPLPLLVNYYQKLNYILGPKEREGMNEFIKLHKEIYENDL